MKSLVRIIVTVAIMLCGTIVVNAQSMVYFYVKSVTSAEVKISKNGSEIFELRGPVKKTINPVGPMKMASVSYKPAYRKCQFKDEGKTLFSVDFDFTNVTTGDVRKLAAEIQLNLEEGSVHHVQLTWKGLNDVQFKELSDKEVAKLMKDKSIVELPEYVEQ